MKLLIIAFIFLYAIWLPLSFFISYVRYKEQIQKIPSNFKGSTIRPHLQRINQQRNHRRRKAEKELKVSLFISFVPLFNIVHTLSIAKNKS